MPSETVRTKKKHLLALMNQLLNVQYVIDLFFKFIAGKSFKSNEKFIAEKEHYHHKVILNFYDLKLKCFHVVFFL